MTYATTISENSVNYGPAWEKVEHFFHNYKFMGLRIRIRTFFLDAKPDPEFLTEGSESDQTLDFRLFFS
jgi:hypothetical protein